ncbi:B-cell receptor CD22-like isoform X2 [Trematomus bernacchii]|uniref:B-cell receptor CD22-like isoform X2 n=1 Tax=Trematomus bernacchii TaxID=40690 RepID=UPI00146AD185|nr:B-cell receptor CD22-like isoform X2 [Trematomus bernacchii]XP_033985499.1 B-cell receptor CD22-like isoform X2 [Trematomus bernacchii]
MSLTASGFVVFLLSMPVVQGQEDWGVTYTSTEICAVKGSTVEISCSYTYPFTWKDVVNTVGKTFWCAENKDEEPVDLKTVSEYAGRVEDRCENNTCTLRIKNLRESDSAVYKFRFETKQDKYLGEPGVTLFVTDLQVHVSRSRPNTRLQCLSSCRPPGHTSYIWFKNGQKIKEDTSPYAEIAYDSADGYSCAVKGYEDFPSPSVLVHGQGSWGVTYTSTKICAVKASTVEINCSYTYPSILKGGFNRVQNKFWFTKWRGGERVDLTTESEYAGRVEDLCENNICTLRIKNLRESDSAEYMFRFTTNNGKYAGLPVTLSVTDLQVQVSRSGSDVNLQCLSSCPPGHTSYIWFKNGQEVKEDTSLYADFNYDSAESYTCALKGHEDFPSPSVYAPKLPSVSVSPSAEIEEGSSVTLTCSSDANPAANYTWYKENEDSPKASGQIFNITDFRAEHSGSYSCGAQNKLGRSNSTLHLSVVAGSSTMILNIIWTTPLVLILIPVFLVGLWMRKKKTISHPTTEAHEPEEIELDSDPVYENFRVTAAHGVKSSQMLT